MIDSRDISVARHPFFCARCAPQNCHGRLLLALGSGLTCSPSADGALWRSGKKSYLVGEFAISTWLREYPHNSYGLKNATFTYLHFSILEISHW